MKFRSMNLSNFQCWNGDYHFKFDKYNCIIGENNSGKSAFQNAIIVAVTSQDIDTSKICRENWTKAQIILNIVFEEHDTKQILKLLFPNFNEFDLPFLDLISEKQDFWSNLVIYNVKSTPAYYSKDGEEITNANFLGVWTDDEIPYPMEFQRYIQNQVDINLIEEYGDNFDFTREIRKLENLIKNYIMQNVIFIPSKRKIKETEHASMQTNQELPEIIPALFYIYDGTNVKRLLFDAALSEDKQKKNLFKKFQDIVSKWSFSLGIPDITAQSGGNINLIFRNEEKTPIQLHELGDGLKEAIILAAICIANHKKIIIIEEPELYLHPRAMRELRRLFIDEIDGQVIVSTHNPIMLGEIEEGVNILKITKNNDQMNLTSIKNIEDYIEFKTQFDLRNSDFLFYDCLLFVEGKSDYAAFSEWIKELYGNEKYVGIIKLGGSGDIPSALTLSFMLQIHQIFKYVIVTDKDKFDPEEKKEEIIKNLEGKDPDLVAKVGRDVIKSYIYVLEKKNLEEYFKSALRVIAEDWEIEVEELEKVYSERKTMISNIKSFAKAFDKTFKKSREIPKWASNMQSGEISSEIKTLIESIIGSD